MAGKNEFLASVREIIDLLRDGNIQACARHVGIGLIPIGAKENSTWANMLGIR